MGSSAAGICRDTMSAADIVMARLWDPRSFDGRKLALAGTGGVSGMRELRPLPSARLFVLIDRCLLGACWPVTCLADSRCLFTVADRCLLDRRVPPPEVTLPKPSMYANARRCGGVKKRLA